MLIIDEIDQRATYHAVEKAFEQYRLYRFCEIDRIEPAVTQAYSVREHGPTNVTSDQTANTAIKNADAVSMLVYCRQVEKIVDNLHPMEKLIIENRYMKEYVKDYQVYNFIFNPPISEKTYRKLRWNAVRRIANALGIIQFQPKKVVKNPV